MMCVSSPPSATSHTSTNTGQTWPITSQVTCTSENVIYRVTCEKQCGQCRRILPYIGMTKNRACDRIQQHRGSIYNPGQQGSTKAVAQHFQSSGHTFSHFKTLVIEKVRSKSEFVLRSRERFWIRQCKSWTELAESKYFYFIQISHGSRWQIPPKIAARGGHSYLEWLKKKMPYFF